METLEKVAKYVQSLTIKTPGNVIDVVQVFLLITLKIFTPFSSVSIVDFEQVNVSCEIDNDLIGYFYLFLF